MKRNPLAYHTVYLKICGDLNRTVTPFKVYKPDIVINSTDSRPYAYPINGLAFDLLHRDEVYGPDTSPLAETLRKLVGPKSPELLTDVVLTMPKRRGIEEASAEIKAGFFAPIPDEWADGIKPHVSRAWITAAHEEQRLPHIVGWIFVDSLVYVENPRKPLPVWLNWAYRHPHLTRIDFLHGLIATGDEKVRPVRKREVLAIYKPGVRYIRRGIRKIIRRR